MTRIFWSGAAAALVVAALVAIVAIVGGGFDDTDGRILLTLVNVVFAGGAAAAGLTLLERRRATLLGRSTIALAAIELLVVVTAIWRDGGDADALVRAALTALIVLGALLVATLATLHSRTARTAKLAWAAGVTTALGAAITIVMVFRDNGDGWQVAAVLWIIGVLCAALVPIVERLRSDAVTSSRHERIVASLDGVEVVALRDATPGSLRVSLEPGEQLVLRRRGI